MQRKKDSLVASAHSCQSPSPPKSIHVKSTGCMPGIFHLISKFQLNKSKLLSYGRKQGKISNFSLPVRAPSTAVVVKLKKDLPVPRSPTIQPINRIRTKNSAENIKYAPASVARLMGLEERAKRRDEYFEVEKTKLLQALDNCSEDLEALKKIINSVERVSENAMESCMRRCPPSSVCGLDEFTRSPLCNFAKVKHNGHKSQERKPPQKIKRLGAYETVEIFKKYTDNFLRKLVGTTLPRRRSKAMMQSVEEVWNDIEWGQKREIGRIGLVLHDQIYWDLIEELVKEMNLICVRFLLFKTYKKRLSF